MENEKSNIFRQISLWWRFEGKYYHKDFMNGVKNLVRWFPVIWKDRDWDDHFIWKVMMQKLKFQSKYIGDNDRHMSAKRDAEIMMTCVRLMEKVKEEYYGMEYMDYQESNFNFIDCETPGYKELKIDEVWEKYDHFFAKYPLVHKRMVQKYPNEDKKYIAMKVALENHNRARRLLFKLMEVNIERWWD